VPGLAATASTALTRAAPPLSCPWEVNRESNRYDGTGSNCIHEAHASGTRAELPLGSHPGVELGGCRRGHAAAPRPADMTASTASSHETHWLGRGSPARQLARNEPPPCRSRPSRRPDSRRGPDSPGPARRVPGRAPGPTPRAGGQAGAGPGRWPGERSHRFVVRAKAVAGAYTSRGTVRSPAGARPWGTAENGVGVGRRDWDEEWHGDGGVLSAPPLPRSLGVGRRDVGVGNPGGCAAPGAVAGVGVAMVRVTRRPARGA
jgi:hypothetical protein